MTRRDVTDPSLTLKETTRLRRKLDREWMPALTSSEAKCMTFLFNMVTDWGKLRDRVKQEQFVNGTKSQAGTGLSLRTVIRALASLTEKGAVTRLRTPRGHVYTINFDWSPAAHVKARKALAKPVPAPEETPVICQPVRPRYANSTDAHLRAVPTQDIPSNRPPDGCASPEIKRDRPGREKKEPYLDPLDKVNLRATWTAALAEAFPDITTSAWGRREEAQACQFVNVDDKAKRANALEVFAWSVRSWRTIVAARFAWMDKSPPSAFPDIGFMLRWRDRFYDAWSDRERLRAEITMTGKDRRVRKLMHAGLTQEEATLDAEARDGLAVERAKLTAERTKLSEMMRTIEERSRIIVEQRLAARHPVMQRSAPVRPNTAITAAFDCLPAIGADL